MLSFELFVLYSLLIILYRMKEPNYGEAISHAWKLVWHHKILWALGILAMFVGQFGLGDFVGKIWVFGERLISGTVQINYLLAFFALDKGLNWLGIINFICLFLAGIVLAAVIVFISITAQGALMAAAIEGYKNSALKDFGKFWKAGVKHFWKLLVANLVVKILLAVLLVFLFASWKILFGVHGFWAMPAMTLTLALVLFLGLVVSAWFIYTVGHIMSENRDIVSAAKLGWKMFSKHILVSVELSVVLFFFGILLLGFILLVFTLLYLPAVLVGLLGAWLNSLALLIVGVVFGSVLAVVFLVLVGGMFNAFTVSAWAYMFVLMHREGIGSHLICWFKNTFKLR